MKKNFHVWLLRIYSLIILIVLFGKFLEGAAFNIVIALTAIAIIVQSFLIEKK
jgi:hypothetical protein